jgi:septum formation protein
MTESNREIILASTSGTRARLLKAAGVRFRAVAPQVDEEALRERAGDTGSREMAALLAEAKAVTVSKRLPSMFVVGADQILIAGEAMLNKPRDRAEARRQLQHLRGRTHVLDTSVACAVGGKVMWTASRRARLTMRAFSDRALDDYLEKAGAEASESVGGYKIEGPALQLFSRIEGDHFAILGLPLLPLLAFLRRQGVLLA